MNTFRKIWLSALITTLFVSLLPAHAEVTWDKVQSTVKAAKSYTVIYKYDGPNGIFDFDYRYAGDKIRTEITDSKSDKSKRGTVLVYDKAWKADKIRAKTGGGMIVRNLSHKDVEGKPFYQSLYGMIIKQANALGKPTAKVAGDKTIFTFGSGASSYKIWANDAGEILKTERKDGRDSEVREFSSISWNGSPKMDF
jgi:hypothetical protein